MTEAGGIETAKADLRSKALKRRAAIGSQQRAEAGKQAAAHFFDNVPLVAGQAIAVYWPIRDELDSRPLLMRLMDEEWAVCLPAVTGPDTPLAFRRWELGAPLYPAGLGTLEPAEDAPAAIPEVMVMPLLGFDKAGTRLGYGGAYYDRTLAGMAKRPLLVGYAFALQEFETIPREAHDIGLDLLIHEGGALRFTAAAG